jgi:hypothetical protein
MFGWQLGPTLYVVRSTPCQTARAKRCQFDLSEADASTWPTESHADRRLVFEVLTRRQTCWHLKIEPVVLHGELRTCMAYSVQVTEYYCIKSTKRGYSYNTVIHTKP